MATREEIIEVEESIINCGRALRTAQQLFKTDTDQYGRNRDYWCTLALNARALARELDGLMPQLRTYYPQLFQQLTQP